MKAQVNVTVGDYDTTRRCYQFYELPGLVEGVLPGDLSDKNIKNGATRETDLLSNADLIGNVVNHSSALSLHADFDDNDDRHCVRLVNIPITSTKEVEFFSSELRVSGFTERVYISALQQGPHRSYTSFCHFETGEPRCKQVVDLRPKMTPIDYLDTMVLLRDCTRKRFRTGMNCWPRLRPVQFKETCYVTPKRLESTYVSYCDYGTNMLQTRYQSALQLTPRAFCNNFVHGFEFNSEDDEDDYASETEETSSVEGEGDEDYSGFMESEGENYILNYSAGVRPVATTSTLNNKFKESDIWEHTKTNQNIGELGLSAMIAGGREIINTHMAEKDLVDGVTREVLVEKENDPFKMDGRKSLSDKWKDVDTQKNIKGGKNERKERISSGDLLDFSNDNDDVFSLNIVANTNKKR